jgi:hypothetical protein
MGGRVGERASAGPTMVGNRFMRRRGRVVEGARLESEYTAKPYRGFESLRLRHTIHPHISQIVQKDRSLAAFRLLYPFALFYICSCTSDARCGEECGDRSLTGIWRTSPQSVSAI